MESEKASRIEKGGSAAAPEGRSLWPWILIGLLTCAVVVLAVLLAVYGGKGRSPQSEAQYKPDWQKIMEEFNKRVEADDKKANDLVAKDDISGLISLINSRIANVDEVIGKLMKLYPPDSLRKMYALTLFYLTSLKDQLIAQNRLYEAVLAGQPTTDLKTVADTATSQTRAIGAELGLELNKLGIKFPANPPQEPPSSAGQNSAEPGSAAP